MLKIIVEREFLNLLRSKGVRITTAVFLALCLIGGLVGRYLVEKNNIVVDLPPVTGITMEENPFGYMLGSIAAGLLIFCVVLGSSMINQGVVEEKQSRVVEILLTTVKPRTLLMGKILGVGSAVLLQFILLFAGIIGALALAGVMPSIAFLQSIGFWSFLPTLFIWVILGFLTFAGISGALAATVSRQEDLGSISTLLAIFAMVPMYTALYLTPNLPDSTWNIALTYVPFFSPSIVPMRVALGQIGWFEQLGAMAITVVAIIGLAVLAGKIYERSILHMGSRVKISQLFGRS